MKRLLLAAAAIAMSVSTATQAQSLTTAAPNNGSGGVFMNLTSNSAPLSITQFDVPFAGGAGVSAMVEVWTRPGSYVGFHTSSAGWTLTQTVSATTGGSSVFAPVILSTPLSIAGGETLAVYLHSITTSQGLRYTGTAAAPPQTTWSNADLTLFSDVARTGTVAFAGTANTPRTFSGTVHYQVIPAPGALALLAAAGLATRRRRRA